MLGLSITLLVSMKAKTYMEAQQVAGIVVVPFLALIVIQILGVVTFNLLSVVVFSVFLFAANYLILNKIGPRFSREAIINTL